MNKDANASKNEPLLIEPARLTDAPTVLNHETLKYHLLGPSLTKSGQDNVDQQKVCDRVSSEAALFLTRK